MKKIKVLNNSITITTDLSLEEIRKLEKYAPKALKIIQKTDKDETTEVFSISADNFEGDISKFGIKFNQETSNKCATITALTACNFATEEAKEIFLKENLFETTKYLVAIEKQATAALKQLDKEMTAFKDLIDTIDIE